MEYPPKEMECRCGNRVTVSGYRTWCTKCGKPVYYDPKNQKKHTMNTIYVFLVFIGSITFLVYVYLELIARYAFE